MDRKVSQLRHMHKVSTGREVDWGKESRSDRRYRNK